MWNEETTMPSLDHETKRLRPSESSSDAFLQTKEEAGLRTLCLQLLRRYPEDVQGMIGEHGDPDESYESQDRLVKMCKMQRDSYRDRKCRLPDKAWTMHHKREFHYSDH
ncbi:hypothetical protein HOLleu_00978 [Holothuria leucospilota]|uniref:Uncharacterized protein n=1 Tax=Holothuria leucospilota TaxID=206669 RepID=A0A9Q1HEM2_HOLLE|nr:hypothetical protein HOLleu_10607 [Holothuria leucospilota]KAJ8048603.1 hypothetical protein HOLleu_00978 [Holothuria leucospilota]